MNELYGLVLTGGQSRRMQRDKSALCFHGKPQVQHVFDLLSLYCAKVFVSNRKEQSTLEEQKDLPQIHDLDEYADVGPLAGILSAMKTYPGVPWIVLACDLPFVSKHILA